MKRWIVILLTAFVIGVAALLVGLGSLGNGMYFHKATEVTLTQDALNELERRTDMPMGWQNVGDVDVLFYDDGQYVVTYYFYSSKATIEGLPSTGRLTLLGYMLFILPFLGFVGTFVGALIFLIPRKEIQEAAG